MRVRRGVVEDLSSETVNDAQDKQRGVRRIKEDRGRTSKVIDSLRVS